MNIESLSEDEVEEIVRAFKDFIKKVIKHSAIDYARKIKSTNYREIVYSDLVDYRMPLSVFDDGIFWFDEKIEDRFQDDNYNRAMNLLSKTEKEIFKLSVEGYSNIEIANKLNTTVNCIKATKSRARRKLIKRVEEYRNERK